MVPDVEGSDGPMVVETRHGTTQVLTMNRPERRNVLSAQMRAELLDGLRRAHADDTVRMVVLAGSGGNFSAGGDLGTMDVKTLDEGRQRFDLSHALVRAVMLGPKPVIAAVDGWAAGAGLSLALACDLVIASAGARFWAGFVKVGLAGDLGIAFSLPGRVGAAQARKMLLFQKKVEADEALAIGLIDEVAQEASAEAAALRFVASLDPAAPLPIAAMKQVLASGLEDVLAWEREAQAALFVSRDHAEGKAAFFQKRIPQFRGK